MRAVVVQWCGALQNERDRGCTIQYIRVRIRSTYL